MDAAATDRAHQAGRGGGAAAVRISPLLGERPAGPGLHRTGTTPEFKAAVEQTVEQFKTNNPGVRVTVKWAS